MAITESRVAATQLTASGTSTSMSISGALGKTCFLKHSNGTGTVTAAGTFDVQIQNGGGTSWFSVTRGPVLFATADAPPDTLPIPLPDSATACRVVYVAPTGPTGFTLDAECGKVTF